MKASGIALAILVLSLAAIAWFWRPFQSPICQRRISILDLSPAQKQNIRLAAEMVNGKILMPNESFSFNNIVGPRDTGYGFRAAPSYLGPDSPMSMGGGICVLSSALYQAALQTNLKIDERHPHQRTISSIKPGLDATVWYGRADLRFTNTSTQPIKISCLSDRSALLVRFLSDNKGLSNTVHIQSSVLRSNGKQVLVLVEKQQGSSRTFVSKDLYWR